jgi:hypothetical protein
VEGPSDRTYIRAWMHAFDPELVEGVHFSLAFYGGALLRYLSPHDPAIEEFVALPRINRNFAVVIDSDRTRRGARLSQTKERVRRGVAESADATTVWVTSGYTVENYVPQALLAEAVAAVHPGARCTWDGARYVNPLGKDQLRRRKAVDKPAVARHVADRWADDGSWTLDLRARLAELTAMVRRANDLPRR